MGFQTILVTISAMAALAYLLHYRLRAPSRKRTVIKSVAAGALGLASLVGHAPLTLTLFYFTAALADAFLARENEEGFYLAMATALLSQLFLCLALITAWTGIDAPLVAGLGLAGIWIGYFMLIWGGLKRKRAVVICYSQGCLVATYLALGTTTFGQLAVIAILFYLLEQVLLALNYFTFKAESLEAKLTGHGIWITYYTSLLLFFVALGS